MQEFTADLKLRVRGVWRDAELVDPFGQHAQQQTGHLSFLVCHGNACLKQAAATPLKGKQLMPISHGPALPVST